MYTCTNAQNSHSHTCVLTNEEREIDRERQRERTEERQQMRANRQKEIREIDIKVSD